VQLTLVLRFLTPIILIFTKVEIYVADNEKEKNSLGINDRFWHDVGTKL